MRERIMATEKPRITITLEPEQYAVLSRLSKLQGGSMSRIVVEFLSECVPVLDRMCDALDIARQAQGLARTNLRKAIEQTEQELQPLAAQVLNQMDLWVHAAGRDSQAARSASTSTAGSATRTRPERSEARAAAQPPGALRDPRPVITGVRGTQRGTSTGSGKPRKAAGRKGAGARVVRVLKPRRKVSKAS
jgi:hypothetical protein